MCREIERNIGTYRKTKETQQPEIKIQENVEHYMKMQKNVGICKKIQEQEEKC